MSEENLPTLNETGPSELVGVASAVAREESEIKAAIVVAKRFPRNEQEAFVKAVRSFERGKMAENAEYCFPRGGTNIIGPSVDLARECARCWGNIRYGLRIVKLDEEEVHIKGYAFDMETNNYIECEDIFARKIQRKIKGTPTWIKPDERDLRELINRRGAIAVRNAILQILPPDLVEACQKKAQETVKKAVAGELKQSREETVKTIALAFARFGVTVTLLEKKLNHSLKVATDDEIIELRKIFKSLSDGVSQVQEHFELEDSPKQDPKTDELNTKLKTRKE